MLLNQLEKISDPRSYHGREYRHYDVLYFTILAILSNSKTYDVGALKWTRKLESTSYHLGGANDKKKSNPLPFRV